MADEKILKSEELTDAELDKVAGGTKRELGLDEMFLQNAGLLPRYEASADAKVAPDVDINAVRTAFAKQKVTLIEHNDDFGANEYYMNGKQVNRVDVLRQIAKNTRMKNFNVNAYM